VKSWQQLYKSETLVATHRTVVHTGPNRLKFNISFFFATVPSIVSH
jgi:hypothetical protein